MLDKEETQETLDKFRKYVIQQAKSNLSKSKKNTSKKLYNSINGVSKVNPNSISLYFEMLDYGLYQDKGVSGKKKKYNTPYKYTNKMPPPNKLDKWIVRKGLAPRDTKGRFTGRSISSVGFAKSISFLIARSIYMNGIKPSLFFTKPFRKYTQDLPIVIAEALRIDADKFFEVTIKTNR